MNEKMKDLLFKLRKGILDTLEIMNEIEHALIKDDIRSPRETLMKEWIEHYKGEGYNEEEARKMAEKKYIEALERQLVHNAPF
jgi:hypothetical protein